MTHPALILAGGAARRLGGIDKPLLELGGRSLLERIIELLAAQAGPIALSANGDPARFASFGLPVLPDGAFGGQGPLAGVLAGLDWAAAQGAEALLTVPGDTRFIPPDPCRGAGPAARLRDERRAGAPSGGALAGHRAGRAASLPDRTWPPRRDGLHRGPGFHRRARLHRRPRDATG
jgi:hypothetical protein